MPVPQCQVVSELAEPDAPDRTLYTVPKALPAHWAEYGPYTEVCAGRRAKVTRHSIRS
jgi:hypothetical protein